MSLRFALVAVLGLFACDSNASNGADTSDTTNNDTTDTTDTADTNDGSDTADSSDTSDTADTTPGGPIAAVPGARCKLSERIGLIEVEAQGPSTVYLNGSVSDRPNPYYGEPELADAACAFHRFNPQGACAPCDEDELCGIDGVCVKAPVRRTDTRVVVDHGGQTTELAANGETGEIFGELASDPQTYALTLHVGDQRITLGATTVPGALNASGTLSGDSMDPKGVTTTWAAQAGDSQVYTRISINHHAAGPTFTECHVPASSGTLSIAGTMLKPLAVVTGLEFQGLEHQRVAAAETAAGCIEFRFFYKEFTSLTEQ